MNTRIKELDGIRGIAILTVIVWHYFTCSRTEFEPNSILPYLYLSTTAFWSGVDLFFVLSGFLIGGIILDNYQKEGFLKVFWIKRSCRILPLAALLLAACWIFKAFLNENQYSWLFHQLMPWESYATFTQNIFMGVAKTYGGHFLGITWSLAVEEQFYLLAPIMILLFGKQRWINSLAPLVVFAFFLRLLFPGFHVDVNTIFRMDGLLVGVLIAALTRNTVIWSEMTKIRGVILSIFAGLLLTTCLLIRYRSIGQFSFTWFSILHGCFLLVALLYKGSKLTAILRSPLLTFWGSISYGLYMFHEAVSGLLHGWLRNGAPPSVDDALSIRITMIAFLTSTLIAWVSLHTYEAFFLRIGRSKNYDPLKTSPSESIDLEKIPALATEEK